LGKINETHWCKIINRGGILVTKELLIGLQNLHDSDLYVWQGLSQQLATSFGDNP
jgi:hypothetical protein